MEWCYLEKVPIQHISDDFFLTWNYIVLVEIQNESIEEFGTFECFQEGRNLNEMVVNLIELAGDEEACDSNDWEILCFDSSIWVHNHLGEVVHC